MMFVNKTRFLFPIFFIFLLSINLQCQEDELSNLLMNMDLSEDASRILIEEIEYYKVNKISLLKANRHTLAELPLFNAEIAREIAEYLRKKSKNANNGINKISIDDICAELELSEIESYILKNCTYFEEINTKKDKVNSYYFRALADFPLQRNKGIAWGKYLGSNFASSNKMLISIDDYRFGIYLDKDVGEEKLNDFYSFFAKKSFGNHKILIGNFKQMASLGLLFGPSMSLSKYYSITAMNEGIDRYSKADLSSYNIKTFRGISYNYNAELFSDFGINLSIFYSNQNRSASLDTLDRITSLYSTNLFRTPSEIAKKDNTTENTIGAGLGVSGKQFSLQYSAFSLRYDRDYISNKIAIPLKSGMFAHSLGLNFNFANVNSISEIALYQANIALQSNVIINFDDDNAKLGFRYYSPDYYSPFGTNLYNGTSPSNELGFSAGYSRLVSNQYRISLATDYYETLRRGYFNYMPINGIDFEIRNEFYFSQFSRLNLLLKYANQDVQINATDTNNREVSSFDKKKSIRAKTAYSIKFENNIILTARAELSYNLPYYNNISRLGYLFGGDINYNPMESLNLQFSGAYYNTDDFSSSVYYYNAFYNYSGSIKALFSRGIFGKANIRYSIGRNIKLSTQYWINNKLDETVIGSGDNRINAAFEHYCRLAMEFAF